MWVCCLLWGFKRQQWHYYSHTLNWLLGYPKPLAGKPSTELKDRYNNMDLLQDYSTTWLLGLAASLLVTGVIAGIMAGLLGVGGGIVIVPVLYHLFSLLGVDEAVKMHVAVGTSLATIIPTSIMSARTHRAKGNLDADLLKGLLPAVIVGVIIGTAISGSVRGVVLSTIFASVALLVSIQMGLGAEKQVAGTLPKGPARQGLGFVIGGFSSMMGIGGGTLSVPILKAFNVPMHRAVGTGAALGIVISIPGALGFLINGWGAQNTPPFTLGYINLIGFALIVPMTIWMAPVGARLASRINAPRLKQVFALFLFITAVRMFYNLLASFTQ